jgi:hypothetical protein
MQGETHGTQDTEPGTQGTGPPDAPRPPIAGEGEASIVNYYRARTDVNLPVDGGMEMIPQGSLLPAHSPIIKGLNKNALAEHFKEVKPGGGVDDGFGPFDVEEATAKPGTKRGAPSEKSEASKQAK